MKEVKKMLNAKLKHHSARPHALPHEIFAYIYIYIYILMIIPLYLITNQHESQKTL